MKKFFKVLAVILAVAIPFFSFAACSAKSFSEGNAAPDTPASPGFDLGAPDIAEDGGLNYNKDYSVNYVDGTSSVYNPALGDKIIYSGYCNIETKEFDKSVNSILALLAKYNGFIESSSTSGRNYNYYGEYSTKNRYANYVLRIPAENFDAFLNEADSIGVVTSKGQNSQNITGQFVDTKARLESYKVQEARLLELLAKAETMSDLLVIEDKLSQVRYNIESLQTSLNNMQTEVDYSTVQLYLYEVKDYTPVEEVSFWEMLVSSVAESWQTFAESMGTVLIVLVYAFPFILVAAIILVVAVVISRKRFKKRNLKKGIDNEKK